MVISLVNFFTTGTLLLGSMFNTTAQNTQNSLRARSEASLAACAVEPGTVCEGILGDPLVRAYWGTVKLLRKSRPQITYDAESLMDYIKPAVTDLYVYPTDVEKRKIAYGSDSNTKVYGAGTPVGLSDYLHLFELFTFFLNLNATQTEPITANCGSLNGFYEFTINTTKKNYHVTSNWNAHRDLFYYFFMNKDYLRGIVDYLRNDKVIDDMCKLVRCNTTFDISISGYDQEQYLNTLMKSYEQKDSPRKRTSYVLFELMLLSIIVAIGLIYCAFLSSSRLLRAVADKMLQLSIYCFVVCAWGVLAFGNIDIQDPPSFWPFGNIDTQDPPTYPSCDL